MENYYDGLEQWCSRSETSEAVGIAIHELPGDPDRIWQEPTLSEFACVIKRIWELANADENELYWGIETIYRDSKCA